MSSPKVQQLQLLQQNVENLTLQKQQLESQLTELDCSLSNLNGSPISYRIIGKIMVAVPASTLQKELNEKHEVITLRLQNLQKQEEKLGKNIEQLQKEVVAELRKK